MIIDLLLMRLGQVINVVYGTMSNIVEAIKCAKLASPITYLGVSLGGNPRRRMFWD